MSADMLIGDFSLRLTEFASSGSFGIEELDDHFKPLASQLIAFGVDPAGRVFHILLSFLLNQGTQWDVFAMPFKRSDPVLYAALAHGRHVLVPADTHEEADQYDGILLALPALDDEFILIVDDWNWFGVQRGTRRGLADSSCRILYEVVVMTTEGDVYPSVDKEKSAWHNGYFIAAIRKSA